MKQQHLLLVLLLVLLTSCSFLTPEFTEKELSYIKWAEKGMTLTFTSNRNQTKQFVITDVVYERKNSGGGLQSFYYTITQTMYYKAGAMMEIRKDSPGSCCAYMNIFFEGSDAIGRPCDDSVGYPSQFKGIYSIKYVKGFITDTVVNQVFYTDVKTFHTNTRNSKVSKIIWSRKYGILQYTTNDGIVWTRQNVIQQYEQATSSFFDQTTALIIGLVVLAIVVVYAVVALFVLNRR